MVISSIAALTALRLPALRQARETARMVGRLAPLRTYGQTYHHYAVDHADHLPYNQPPNPNDASLSIATPVQAKHSMPHPAR